MKKSPQFDNCKIVFWFKVHLSPGVWDSGSNAKTQNFDGLNIRCMKLVSARDDVRVMELTSTICPVEISMLVRAGSSLLWTMINSTFMIKPCQSQASSVL